MSIRAYYLDARPEHANDSASDPKLRVVSMEYINTLGYDLFSVEGPDYESNARKIARERGFLLTEDSIITWDFDDPKESSTDMVRSSVQKITESQSQSSSNENEYKTFTITPDFMVVGLSGSSYVDMEDPFTKSWIRVEGGEGTVRQIPAGAIRRFVRAEKTKWVIFLKGNRSEMKILWDKEAEEHPVRKEYLKSIGLRVK